MGSTSKETFIDNANTVEITSCSDDDDTDSNTFKPIPHIGLRGPKRRVTSLTMAQENMFRSRQKVVFTAGRPAWFNECGEPIKEPYCIGISGGSGSGKTSVAQRIITLLDIPWVTLLRMDNFYKSLTNEQLALVAKNEYNFDHPSALDFDAILSTLQRIKECKRAEVPIYNFESHKRERFVQTMYGASVLIFEGIFAFHVPEIARAMDLKIFLDTDSDVRLARRLRRDVIERGREPRLIIDQYIKFVKPAFDAFIAPTMALADVIVPRGLQNYVAIDLLAEHINMRLRERSASDSRATLAATVYQPNVQPPSLHLLRQTTQLRGMHTIIRNAKTSIDEFVFYSNRIARLLIEQALSMQTFEPVVVNCSEQHKYVGKRRTSDKICGVSILRSGETFENMLRDVVKDCVIGKILIQTDWSLGSEPGLYYLRLPGNVAQYKVILMDAQVATGAAAIMGIRILIEHDVPEENITLVSLLMSEIGANSVAYAYPGVKLITSAVDKVLTDKFDIFPGIGNFSDRYFGTAYD